MTEKTRPKANLSLRGMTANHRTEERRRDRSQKNALKSIIHETACLSIFIER
jgi:hypothetical protein